MGTLTVTFYKEFHNDILMALVSTAARLIEKQFLNLLNTAIINYTLNDTSEGVLILDSRMYIVQANKQFQQFLKDPSVKIKNLNLSMLFKDVDFGEIQKNENLHVNIRETFLSYKNIYSRVSLDMYRIENYGAINGYVLICRDIGDIIALSQQFVGNVTTFRFDGIITQNPQMLSIIKQCKQIADQKMPVLLEGESGTGKEVFAQSIHNASCRASRPFVAVNCAALPISLVESELFGYEKGSFTDGLTTGRAGKFELANGGTIFLDEIGELPLDVQTKLLRVLDNYRVTRIGGKTEKKLDIRLIAASNRDLYAQVQARTFREDLYYRINVMNFTLPPLSERKEDIQPLVEFFVEQLNMENRSISKKVSDECMGKLCKHNWKGNIRELQNTVTRAYYLCNDMTIISANLPNNILNEPILEPNRHTGTCAEMEAILMRQALDENSGNVLLAANKIGISKATFYRKIKTYNIVI
jgi:transcriptional regulator with PAS, ATPase and Fis domain